MINAAPYTGTRFVGQLRTYLGGMVETGLHKHAVSDRGQQQKQMSPPGPHGERNGHIDEKQTTPKLARPRSIHIVFQTRNDRLSAGETRVKSA
jgi:hypothetical protein